MSLQIQYNFKTFKPTVNAIKTFQAISNEAVEYFKLGTGTYGLFHNGKLIPPGTTIRLANLPPGAKLQLKPVRQSVKEISIKLSSINCPWTQPAKVLKVSTNEKWSDVLYKYLEKECDEVKVQLVSGTIDNLESTLLESGVTDSCSARVVFERSVQPKKHKTVMHKLKHGGKDHSMQAEAPPLQEKVAKPIQNKPTHTAAHVPDPAPVPDVAPVPKVKESITVLKPSATSYQDEPEPEFTIDHARLYQQHLAKQAQRSKSAVAPPPLPTTCHARVRLPNGLNLELTMDAKNKAEKVYSMVQESLEIAIPFELYVSHPYEKLQREADLQKVGSKVSLVFVSTGNPVVKKSYIQNAKERKGPTETETQLHETRTVPTPQAATRENAHPQQKSKLIPKWLKLNIK